jgi:MarR family 2-MHQ and catechol resistance regulon transcriptional repressor
MSKTRPKTSPGHAPPRGAVGDSLKLWVVLSRHGLTLAEFGVLEVLYHKGPVLIGELQKRVLISSGGTTFLVDRLVSKGLVERQSCDTDRRARYAALTKSGDDLVRDIFPAHAARIARATRGLSASKRREATELLRTLGLAAAEAEAPVLEQAPPPRPARTRRARGTTGA